MAERNTYPSIDMIRTGIHLKNLIVQKGYAVKDIQNMLNLSCPQPVYRWFKGQILPSVDHLFVLSKILGVHMEELLVPKDELPDSGQQQGGCAARPFRHPVPKPHIALRTGIIFLPKEVRE